MASLRKSKSNFLKGEIEEGEGKRPEPRVNEKLIGFLYWERTSKRESGERGRNSGQRAGAK